jgi:hypothetical protein
MAQAEVTRVCDELLTDPDLMLDFWTTVEKAVVKAGVSSFTAEDRVGVLAGISEQLNAPSTAAPKVFYFWEPQP